ncbi:C-type lectin domain family 2 member B-like isoform X7 [Ornithorhynchus anatinus]|uniref:C-type lectin domain family 2 member B-like isoform X7 n=1 Tax=Ornithorhynchus anatinus TaxID=9258 RepID=UPI0010A7D1F2|nr:C-type lectin domain family 2 member B-like isoform X7 [Ornithorhynchus anatinus]
MAQKQEPAGAQPACWPPSRKMCIGLAVVIGTIVLILVITLPVTLVAKTGKAECPPGWIEVDGNCFFLSTGTKDWEESKRACEEHNALLTKLSVLQMEVLKSHVENSDYWIGLKKSGDSGWVWNDNSAFHEEFHIRGAGDCAYLDSSSVNSAGCSQPRRWICSKPPQTSLG